MAVTNLTGTKWMLNESFPTTNMPNTTHYTNIRTTSSSGQYTYYSRFTQKCFSVTAKFFSVRNPSSSKQTVYSLGVGLYNDSSSSTSFPLSSGYDWSNLVTGSRFSSAVFSEANKTSYITRNDPGTYGGQFANAKNQSGYLECIEIVSGEDVTNADLISWLETNATRIYDSNDLVTVKTNNKIVRNINGQYIKSINSVPVMAGVTLSHTITVSGTDGTYSGPSRISTGGTATIYITPDTGYGYPDSVTVTGATSSYNEETGVITLSEPTDNVVVSFSCVQLITIVFDIDHATIVPSTFTAKRTKFSGNGLSISKITPDSGYIMTPTDFSISTGTITCAIDDSDMSITPTVSISILITSVPSTITISKTLQQATNLKNRTFIISDSLATPQNFSIGYWWQHWFYVSDEGVHVSPSPHEGSIESISPSYIVSNGQQYNGFYDDETGDITAKGSDNTTHCYFCNGDTKTQVVYVTSAAYSGEKSQSWSSNNYKTITFANQDYYNARIETFLILFCTESVSGGGNN